MTTDERRLLLALLDAEWQRISATETHNSPSRIQYAAAVWTLLELLPTIK